MSPTGEGPPSVPPAGDLWPEWLIAAPPLRPLKPSDATVVGPYRLEALLGEGGMGRVYLGRTPAGRAVAVKVVHRQYASDLAFRKRFAREVETAKQVHGLYTAPVVEADVEADEPWLATAYISGPSLQYAVVEHGPLPIEAARRLIAGVAEALHSIHVAGVTHRDLKPSNVILTADGPTVIDFGIARAADVTSITNTDVRPGTPSYMAPEQIRGESVTPAADVFALGVLAAFAATGRAAFGGGEGVTYRILELAPDLDDCPEPVRRIAAACLTKDRRRRPTPVEVVELCQDASTERPGVPHHSPPPLPPAASTRPDIPVVRDSDSATSPDVRPPELGAERLLQPGPRGNRGNRTKLLAVLAIVLLVLAGGVVAMSIVMNNQYFVGEGEDGEIAVFQGAPGSILGISLNTQVQGSCDPDVTACDKFYVLELRELGRDAVRAETQFDTIADARSFILGLRTKYPLPTCESLLREQQQARPPTSTSPSKQPAGSPSSPPRTTSEAPEPEPGVNCRVPRGDKGGG